VRFVAGDTAKLAIVCFNTQKVLVEQMAQAVWRREPVRVACWRDITRQRASEKAKCRPFVGQVPDTIYIWVRKAEVAFTRCATQVETAGLGERVAEHSRAVRAAEISLARKGAAVTPAGRQHPGAFIHKFLKDNGSDLCQSCLQLRRAPPQQ